MDTKEVQELTQFAASLLEQAGRVTLPCFRSALTIENKQTATGAFDPVTQADRDAETVMRTQIRQTYPAHGIYGEEYGHMPGSSPYTWMLDPIDGTRSFIAGIPLWGTLVALNDGTYPCIGAMGQPYTGEIFLGNPEGAYLRRHDRTENLQTRPCVSLENAILGCTDPVIFTTAKERQAFETLCHKTKVRRFGGDCYFYALLAAGHLDLVVESGLKPHDIQALIPIVESAGGFVTSWDGGDAQNGGQVIAAGDPRVHKQALEILTPAAVDQPRTEKINP